MNRRGFLKSMLAAGAASYVVTSAGVLMPVRKLWTPLQLWGDGIHDDTAALQAWINGEPVIDMRTGASLGRVLIGGEYQVSQTIYMTPDKPVREMLGNVFVRKGLDDYSPMFHYTPADPLDTLPFSNVQVRRFG